MSAVIESQNPFKVGDILHHSWGYDQTQCDYYQVVVVTKASVGLRKIAAQTVAGSGGGMCDSRLPVKDKFLEPPVFMSALSENYDRNNVKPVMKRAKVLKTGERVTPFVHTRHGWCSLWDGTANYCSWYA